MTEAGWRDPDAPSLAPYLDGADAPDLAADGSPMLDDDFLLLVNAWWEPLDFTIPPTRPGQTWLREIDTFDPAGTEASATAGVADQVAVRPRSVVVLRAPATP
jgi:isoamylase